MVAVLEQVDEMDASEFHVEKLYAKEMVLHKLVKKNNLRRTWNIEKILEEISF